MLYHWFASFSTISCPTSGGDSWKCAVNSWDSVIFVMVWRTTVSWSAVDCSRVCYYDPDLSWGVGIYSTGGRPAGQQFSDQPRRLLLPIPATISQRRAQHMESCQEVVSIVSWPHPFPTRFQPGLLLELAPVPLPDTTRYSTGFNPVYSSGCHILTCQCHFLTPPRFPPVLNRIAYQGVTF